MYVSSLCTMWMTGPSPPTKSFPPLQFQRSWERLPVCDTVLLRTCFRFVPKYGPLKMQTSTRHDTQIYYAPALLQKAGREECSKLPAHGEIWHDCPHTKVWTRAPFSLQTYQASASSTSFNNSLMLDRRLSHWSTLTQRKSTSQNPRRGPYRCHDDSVRDLSASKVSLAPVTLACLGVWWEPELHPTSQCADDVTAAVCSNWYKWQVHQARGLWQDRDGEGHRLAEGLLECHLY